MKIFSGRAKRWAAMLLALVIVVSSSNVVVYAQGVDGTEHSHAHSAMLSELIVSNYELTANEEAIISSGTLKADEGYSYVMPPEEVADGGIIRVDEENKKIFVSAFEDEENNRLWVPVSFDLKNARGVIADHDDLPLTEKDGIYEGEYTATDLQFSVEVTYKLEISVSATKQKALLEAAHSLAEDIDVLKTLSTANIFPEDDEENALTYAKIQAMIDETVGYHVTLTPQLVLSFMTLKAFETAPAEEGKEPEMQSVVDVIYDLTQNTDEKTVEIPEMNVTGIKIDGMKFDGVQYGDYKIDAVEFEGVTIDSVNIEGSEYYLFIDNRSDRKSVQAINRLWNEQKNNKAGLALAQFLTDHATDSYLEWVMLYGTELNSALVSNYEDIERVADYGLLGVSEQLEYLLEDVAVVKVKLETALAQLEAASKAITNNQTKATALLKQIEAIEAQLDSVDLYEEINKQLQANGYGQYEIHSAEDLNNLIATAEAERANKLNELNTMLAQLGYTEKIENADDIDGAIAFLETYDPYAALNAKVKELLTSYGYGQYAGMINIKDSAGVASAKSTLSRLSFMLGADKVAAATALLDQGDAAAQDFLNNRASYIQQLKDGQAALRQADEAIAMMKNLRDVQLPAAQAQIDLYKSKITEAKKQITDAQAKLKTAKLQITAAQMLAKQKQTELLAAEAEAKENQTMLDLLIMIMGLLCDSVEDVYKVAKGNSWNAPKVIDTAKAPNYDELTQWASNLQTTNVDWKEELFVETATVRYNMSMYNIQVVVKGEIVDPTKVDSQETIALPDYTAPVITLRKGADKQEIMDAIAEIAPDAAALAQPLWEGVITTENYDRKADELAADFALGADLVYTITYAPKTVNVTYGEGFEEGHGLPTAVPYGYQLTLPNYEDVNSEYIYAVNNLDNLDQGTIVKVTEDTTITRKKGAMSEKQYLTTLVVKSNPEMDAVLQEIMMSSAIEKGGSISIVVPKNDNLSIYFDEATRQVVIKALPIASRVGDLKWTATSGRLDNSAFSLENGVANTTGSFQMAYVDYKLALTTAALGISDAELLEVMNIPYKLKTDTTNQADALDGLLAQMPYLKKINKYDTVSTPIGENTVPELLNTAAALAEAPDSGFLPTTAGAARALAKLITDNGYLPLCVTLEGYQANGLYDFYTNETAYLAQINELYDLLSLVVEDTKLMGMLPGEYKTGFSAAQAALEKSYKLNTEFAIDHSLVIVREDTLTALQRLLNNLETAQPQQYAQAPATMTWVQTVSGTSPGNSTIIINVSFAGATFTDETWSMPTGSDLDRAELERRIAALTAQAGLTDDMKVHYNRIMTGDSDLVSGPQTIDITYTAKEYPVYVGEHQLGTVTVNGGKIQLPAHTLPGYVYEYTIDGTTTRASEYTFSSAKVQAMLTDGKITITRTAINVAEVELINKANSLGVTLVKDPQQGYMMVLPLSLTDVEGSITPFAMGLFASGSQSIMLGDDYLLYNNKYYMQSLVNALLNSGIDSDRILELIDANGNVVNDLTVSQDQVINNGAAGAQGGILMKTTLTFDDNAPFTFYITLASSKARAASADNTLKQLRDLVAFAKNHDAEIALQNGQIEFTGELPETMYSAYVGALTMVGEADIDNVNALNAEVAVGYLVDMLDTAMSDDVTNKTIANTVGLAGVSVNVSDSVFNILKDVLENKQFRYDSNDESVTYIDLNALPVSQVVDKLQGKIDAMELPAGMAAPQLSSMIAEYDTGLNVTVKADIQNLDKEYVAMSVNLNAVKAISLNEAVVMLTAEELSKVSDGNAVILLDNVGTPENPVDLKLSKAMVLDLNGKTVYGNIIAEGSRSFLVDSDYAANGTVTGTVTGKNLTILSGKYNADVSAYLKTGYQQVNGVVSNKYFTIEQKGSDVIVTLNAETAREIATREHLISLALDIVSELAITHYNTAAMTVDGKTIFDLGVNNVLGILTGNDRLGGAIDTALGCVVAPDLAELVDVLVADITDFQQIKHALETNGVLAAYDFTTSAWDVAVKRNAERDILDLTLSSGTTLKEGTLKLVLTGDFNDRLAMLAGGLADTTTVTSDFSNVQSVTREGKSVLISGDYAGSVVIDFSRDYRYTVVMAVILAEGNPEIRARMVEAIEAFYKTGCTNQQKLEAAFDKLTVQQTITALKNHTRDESFSAIAKKIGLSQSTLEQVLALGGDEMGFRDVVDVAGIVLRKFSPSFNGTLGALKKTDADGRKYYGGDLSKEIDKVVTVKGYSADIDANITYMGAKLYLFADHVHVPGEPVEENRVEASCGNDGSYDMVTYCSVCGDKLHSVTETITASGHSFTNYVSDGNATCTEDGTKTAKCDNCDATNTVADTGSALGHSFTNFVSNNDATCEADGTKTARCDNNCGETKTETDTGSAKGHSFTKYESDGNATCQADGTKTAECDNGCGQTKTVADEGSKLAHRFENYVPDGNATCDQNGTKTAECSYGCGTKDTIADPNTATGHSFTNYVSNGDATCEQDGTETAKCDNCDAKDTRTDADSKLGHKFTTYVSDGNATCTADGTKTAKCDLCQIAEDTIADEGSKLAHKFTTYTSNGDATCTADGTKTAKCDHGCGEKDTVADEGSKLAHKFTTYTSNGDATCTADGTKTAKCDLCQIAEDTIADEGSKLAHKFTTYTSNGDATCTADGTKTASCDYGCGEKDTVADEGSKLAHKFTTYTSNGDATCTADGTKTATCDNGCGTTDTIADEGSATGHSFTNYVSDGNATCTEDGTKTAKCNNCDATDTVADAGSATGHSFTNYVSDGNATCQVDGTKTATCDNCDATDTIADEGSKRAHRFENYESDNNGTCEQAGTLTASCIYGCGTTHTIPDPNPASGHKVTTYVYNNDATCEADGTETATCENCGESFTRTAAGSKLAHKFITYVSNGDATCEADGTKTAKCDLCQTAEDTIADEGSKLGHKFTTYVSDGNATCEADGTKTATCDNGCGKTDTIADEGSATGHSFTKYESDGNATCEADGTKTASCDNGCGKTDTIADEGSKLGHKFTNYVSDGNATCTEDGTKTATCDNGCGAKDTVADTGSAKGHSFTKYESDGNATCQADGTKTAECDNGCGKTDTIADEGSKLAHQFSNYVSNNDATCEQDGTKTGTCVYGCGETDTIADVGTATGHSFTKYESDNNATCTEDGTKTATCDNGCGKTDTVADEGSKLGHKFTNYVSDGNATCTADGTKTATCDNGCGKTDTIADEGSATGHSFTKYESDNNATCTADGTKTAKCDNCDATDTVADTGSAKGHSFTNYVSNGDATCEADGTETAKCDNCDAKDTRTDADSKLGHKFTNYVSDGNATCEADGTKTATCDNGCGKTDTVADEGSKLGHKFTTYVSDGNATCTADGTKTATCDNGCGKTDTIADEGSATGHSFTKYESDNNATCTADGTKTAKCDNCDATDTVADTGSAKGHSFTNYVSNGDATCEADGTETAKCDNCDAKDTRTDADSKLGHKFTTYVSDGNATCEADGTKTASCDNGCGKTDTIADAGSAKGHGTTTLVGAKPADYDVPGYTGDEVCNECGKVVKTGSEIAALVYDVVVTDNNGNRLSAGSDLAEAIAAVQNGATITINAAVAQNKDLSVDKTITIKGADKIAANGNKIFLTDPAAKITADAALTVISTVDGYVVVNNNNVYTMKSIAAPTAGTDVAGVKVAADETSKYLFLDLEPVNGKTLNALDLTFADLAGYNVKLAIAGNDGTGLVKTADTMIVTATDNSGNVVATITYTVIVMGDVNCDGMALSNDATATMQIFFGKVNATKPMMLAADINCDGTIDAPMIGAADAQRIMFKYFNWGKTQGGYETALR